LRSNQSIPAFGVNCMLGRDIAGFVETAKAGERRSVPFKVMEMSLRSNVIEVPPEQLVRNMLQAECEPRPRPDFERGIDNSPVLGKGSAQETDGSTASVRLARPYMPATV